MDVGTGNNEYRSGAYIFRQEGVHNSGRTLVFPTCTRSAGDEAQLRLAYTNVVAPFPPDAVHSLPCNVSREESDEIGIMYFTPHHVCQVLQPKLLQFRIVRVWRWCKQMVGIGHLMHFPQLLPPPTPVSSC